jgi:hypothetical protein
MTEEHTALKADVKADLMATHKSLLYEAAVEVGESHVSSWVMEARCLPPIVLGSGYTQLVNKLVALLWAIKLESGFGINGHALKAYCRAVIGVVTDLGLALS